MATRAITSFVLRTGFIVAAPFVLVAIVEIPIDGRLKVLGLGGLVILMSCVAIFYGIRIAADESRQKRKMRAAYQFNTAHEQVQAERCPNCDYSLVGNMSGICPECGVQPYELLRDRATTFARISKDPQIMYNAGILYASGPDQFRDYSRAHEWLHEAADGGSVVAMRALGLLYLHGQGVAADVSEATAWFGKAAELGYELAKADLQNCLTAASTKDA